MEHWIGHPRVKSDHAPHRVVMTTNTISGPAPVLPNGEGPPGRPPTGRHVALCTAAARAHIAAMQTRPPIVAARAAFSSTLPASDGTDPSKGRSGERLSTHSGSGGALAGRSDRTPSRTARSGAHPQNLTSLAFTHVGPPAHRRPDPQCYWPVPSLLAAASAFAKSSRTPIPVPLVNSIPRRSSSSVILFKVFGEGSASPFSNLATVSRTTPTTAASSAWLSPSRSLAAATCRPETFIYG